MESGFDRTLVERMFPMRCYAAEQVIRLVDVFVDPFDRLDVFCTLFRRLLNKSSVPTILNTCFPRPEEQQNIRHRPAMHERQFLRKGRARS